MKITTQLRRTAKAITIASLLLLGVGAQPASAQDAPADAAPAQPEERSIMLPPLPPPPERPVRKYSDDDKIQELEEVIVEGKRDALSKSDQKLKELKDKLPCTGCDTKTKKIEEKRSFTEKALKAVANQCCIPTRPKETNEADETDRQLTQEIINPKNNHP